MSQIICWRDVVSSGEMFHASRDTKTLRNPLRWHGHDFAEVFWINAGKGTHKINGSKLPLYPGSLVFLRPTDFHGIDAETAQGIQITNIAFSKETFDFLGTRYFSKKPGMFWLRGELPFSLIMDPARLSLFNRWADALSHCPREQLHIERFLLDVLAEMDPGRRQPLPKNAPYWLVHACHEIEKPEHFRGGVETFFRLASRSKEHVARCARQYLGLTPTDYVNRVRMTYAARQLEMSSCGILEIALDCGIDNLSHFYSLFRAEFGTTPRAYRISHITPL